MPPRVAAILSLIVPGLGQLARGRVMDGVLMLWACVWLRLIMAAMARAVHASPPELDAFLYGMFVFDAPARFPILIVATVMVVMLHIWSASDARRDPRSVIAAEQ